MPSGSFPKPHRARPISGLVLAGGASRRMGSDKALLRVGSERLVDRQVRILAEAGADPVFVGLPFADPTQWPLPAGSIAVRDPRPDCGPLAGIVAGLEAADADLLLVVAVDLPRLDPEWIRSLIHHARPGVGVVPEVQGRLEPLAAAFPKGSLDSARARLHGGSLSVQEWVREGIRSGWMEPWPLEASESDVLLNWNRPQDWAPPLADDPAGGGLATAQGDFGASQVPR